MILHTYTLMVMFLIGGMKSNFTRRFYRISILHDFPDFMGINYYTAKDRHVAV